MKPNFLKWRSLLMLTLMVGFLSLTGVANSITVTPPRLAFTAESGGYFEGQIEVYGASDKEIRVKTYFMDWDFDQEGTVQFYAEPNRVERSATAWLRIEPSEFVLPAGGKKMVTISGQVPAGTAPGDYWSMFFVEFLPYSVVQTSGMRMSGRVGGSITITVPGPVTVKGRIDDFTIESRHINGRPGIAATVLFVNEGDSVLEPTGRIEIKDLQNKRVGLVTIPPSKVLPQSSRQIRIQEELRLKPGSYVAIAVVDYGGSKLAGYQKVFTVQ
ncbi:fimbrial biogenesis chaperone [Capillibacterium thermochitinicola]|uniref:Uncharacterized protein n=1 Tax=Capillibacterium thermochitinicola TaxID=2699427 RepID=A0A8J6HZ09_9FIRM|nr:hypothetical protein [Capillibacterium thermochitinicola]MBA2132655.1 hypothetical protein [Capillibacterium thermochitinicola]